MTTEAIDAIYIGIAITTSAFAPTSPSSYSWSKIKGDDGIPGTNGIPGKDGTSSYIHIKWSTDGKTFSDDEGNTPARYQGILTDNNPTASTNFGDYSWTDTAIVVNEVIEEVKTNVADLEISLDNITATVEESVSSANSLEERVAKVEETAGNLNLDFTETKRQLNNLSDTTDRLEDLENNSNDFKNKLATLEATITHMNFNFSTSGLEIGSNNSSNHSILDNLGVRIYSKSALEAIYNKNGSGFRKAIVTESFQMQHIIIKPENITSKQFSGSRPGWAYYSINELVETLEDLEEES